MKLNEIINSGFISYIGDELVDVNIQAFRSQEAADKEFLSIEAEFEGTDAGVLKAETHNGYHLVADMDWKEMDAFESANFIAFAPTLTSCQKLTARLAAELGFEMSQVHFTDVMVGR